MTDPGPGETLQVEIALGDIDTRLVPSVRLDANSNIDTQVPIWGPSQGFTMPPWLARDGRVEAEPLRGGRIAIRGALDSWTQLTAPIDPRLLDDALLASPRARWLPYADYLDSPAFGGRRWWPLQYNTSRGGSDPRMSLYSINPAASTGRGLYGPASPGIAESYRYQGFTGQMARPAMVFDGLSAAAIDPEGGTWPSMTMAVVAVFHPSTLPYYGIFEAANGGFGEPLAIRYTHGRIDVFQADTRVLRHETIKPARYPVILLISMDSATDTGRFYCLDKNRTTREFNVEGLDFVSLLGVVGCLGQGTTGSKWRYGSEMDLLELTLWNRALSFPELESVANLLSLAYGVAA